MRLWPAMLLMLAGCCLTFGVTRAQAGAAITLSPNSGPGGTSTVVSGSGFMPGDTVFVELIGPSGETGRLATVAAGPDGRFAVTVTMPAGGPIEPLKLLAYPLSFGLRSPEAIEQAPKAVFTLTPDTPGLPNTGTGSAGAAPTVLAVTSLTLLLGCAAVLAIGGLRLLRKALPPRT
ncbi:MAG: hypothetical protein ACRDU0_14080 [Mycobacterium sp.]